MEYFYRVCTMFLTVLSLNIPIFADIPHKPSLGINLSGPADWNTEQPLVNVFHYSRKWVSQKPGMPWGKGPAIDLDEHGWVKKLEQDCAAETPLCLISGGHYPGGKYTVLYDGIGTMQFGGAKIIEQTPGRIIIDVNPNAGGIWLKITQTDPQNYLKNIRVIMPGYEKTYQDNPWRRDFLFRWQGFSALRFMDLMHTNNATISKWEDRPTMEDASFPSAGGVPLELLCDLANRLNSDPWFCMPHMADDDYVRQFARMVKDKLNPNLKVYVEYSNEVWNGQFKQNRYAADKGKELGFAEKPWEAAWKYTAYRSVQIFEIWEKEFAGKDRLIRVLPSQSANPAVAKAILSFQDAYKHADALAIAPYVSMNVRTKDADTIVALGIDGVLDRLEKESLPRTIEHIKQNKKIADEFGLKLIAYEAGQHMVGIQGAENINALTALLISANNTLRMGEIYTKYYKAWEEAGGDVMAVFSSVGRWSKWGSWGLMQYADDDPMSQPKMRATLLQAKAWGQSVDIPQ